MASASADGFSFDGYFEAVRAADLTPVAGRVVRVVGLLVESDGPRAAVGDVCEIAGVDGEPPLIVAVVGFRDGRLLSVPLGRTAVRRGLALLPAGPDLLGRVIDPFGRPLDGLGPIRPTARVPLQRPSMNP